MEQLKNFPANNYRPEKLKQARSNLRPMTAKKTDRVNNSKEDSIVNQNITVQNITIQQVMFSSRNKKDKDEYQMNNQNDLKMQTVPANNTINLQSGESSIVSSDRSSSSPHKKWKKSRTILQKYYKKKPS